MYQTPLQNFQLEKYTEAYTLDRSGGSNTKGKGIYSNSRQAALFVFPDGSYGVKGFSKYVVTRNKKSKQLNQRANGYLLHNDILTDFNNLSPREKIEKLKKIIHMKKLAGYL